MVCSLGRGRMAAMARLLETGNFSEITAEEASPEKLAAQSIYRELREADEENLLEEEDMHVFDCEPMADPLHLVCCNACKKPVKASQYVAHAERCRSLNITEETALGLDGGTGHKKPPRRKKLQITHDNQATTVVEEERSESVDADDNVASESNVDEQIGMAYSISREAKGHSVYINGASVMDGSGGNPRSANCSASVMSPSKKRTKLIAAEGLLLSDAPGTACGVTKNMGSCQEAQSCGEISKGSIAGRENPCDSVVGCLKPRQTFEHRMSTKVHTKSDAPAPLATKVYHSQRNNRLRSALSYLYHEASKNSCFSLSPKLVQGSVMLPSPKNSLHEQTNDLPQKKKDSYALHAVRKPDQILSQSSELCLGNSGGHLPVMNFPNQFWDISFSRPALSVDASPMGMMSGRYHPTPNSFPGNSGKSLGTMQQPNGSVPVV